MCCDDCHDMKPLSHGPQNPQGYASSPITCPGVSLQSIWLNSHWTNVSDFKDQTLPAYVPSHHLFLLPVHFSASLCIGHSLYLLGVSYVFTIRYFYEYPVLSFIFFRLLFFLFILMIYNSVIMSIYFCFTSDVPTPLYTPMRPKAGH